MKSYNCFYSALFDILEPYYHENSHLLINNRWQFFYNENDDYTDDIRMIGEWPILFDQNHIDTLKKFINIRVDIFQTQGTQEDILKQIQLQGFALLFINKQLFHNNENKFIDKHFVTVVRISELSAKRVNCIFYDEDISLVEELTLEDIFKAWNDASDYEFLNRCIIHVYQENKVQEPTELITCCKTNLFRSMNQFLDSPKEKTILFGRLALEKFAKDLLHCYDPQKLIHCSMYMQSVINQRKSLFYILPFLYSKESVLIEYVEKLMFIKKQWERIKLLLFIVGKKEQFNSLKHISEQLLILGQRECELLYDLQNSL